MKIELHRIKVKDLFAGFENDEETGMVVGYGGKLNIRPPYQREFVYKVEQQEEVIRTIRKGFPLNIMYWSKNSDGTFELLDGQQRTMSICNFLTPATLSVDNDYFSSLFPEEKKQIEEYELMIYFCEGETREKLDWFKIVNIAGEELTPQELRNSVYTGSWLVDAKRYFSKSGCSAQDGYSNYLNKSYIRQEVLETVLKWISGGNIEDYMGIHQHDANAKELWRYFEDVMEWVQRVFPKYRKEMKGLPWGEFYNEFKDQGFEKIGEENERRVSELYKDDEVTKKSGIYQYILTDNKKYLSLRAFDDNIKSQVYERQNGICPMCREHYAIEEMEADHINPWSKGGKTVAENCQMLCKKDNREKSDK